MVAENLLVFAWSFFWILFYQLPDPLPKARFVVVALQIASCVFKFINLCLIGHVMAVTTSNDDLPSITFYADASSREKNYMVAGGFAVAGERIAEVEGVIAAMRKKHDVREFKWSEYRGGRKREAYEALVNYGFELVENRNAALHMIIANFKGYRHKAVPGEGRDTSINRMYFQLCLHRPARLYGKMRAVHIRLDAGNDSADICDMRNQLCAAAYRQYKTRPNCVRSIEPVDSQKVGLVQLSDVIMGGVAAKRNEVQHTSPKGALADMILERSGVGTWSRDTHRDAKFLTVWNHVTGNGPS